MADDLTPEQRLTGDGDRTILEPGTMAYAFAHPEVIDAAVARAHVEVALRHKRLGIPLGVQRDGRVILIPPDEIEVRPG